MKLLDISMRNIKYNLTHEKKSTVSAFREAGNINLYNKDGQRDLEGIQRETRRIKRLLTRR
jgi:hypothetical protein